MSVNTADFVLRKEDMSIPAPPPHFHHAEDSDDEDDLPLELVRMAKPRFVLDSDAKQEIMKKIGMVCLKRNSLPTVVSNFLYTCN